MQLLVEKPEALGNFLTTHSLLLLLHLEARRHGNNTPLYCPNPSPGKHPGHMKYAFILCLFVVAVVVVGEREKLNHMTELLPGVRDSAGRPECRTS